MKHVNRIYSILACARRVALLSLLFFAFVPQVWGQAGWYTLTNGHFYWFDGTVADTMANGRDIESLRYLTGYDQAQGWAKIYTLGTHAGNPNGTTEIVEQGNVYLALDTTDPANPRVVSVQHDDFSELCVWYRTGSTGNYYQEWLGAGGVTYRYHLVASHAEGLSVHRIVSNEPMTKSVIWYNWDHGLAIEEKVRLGGSWKTSDYWLIYDTLDDATGESAATAEWRMSTVHCYQRPEEMIYHNYRANSAGTGNEFDSYYYYDNVNVLGANFPAGNAATFLSVKKEVHEKHIASIAPGVGLTGLTTGDDPVEGKVMEYGTASASLRVVPTINYTTSNYVSMMTTPAYTEYVEELYRRGMHLNYEMRTEEGFGNAGIAKTREWFFYGTPVARHETRPTATAENATVTSVEYSLDPRATRYLTITPDGNACDLTLTNPPIAPEVVTLTCKVTYSNGTTQTVSSTLTIRYDIPQIDAKSNRAPVVKGYVCGGGRMANVQGNTSVTVHNADSIYAIYGGNDIAGWVQGEFGSTIQIGTENTNEGHPAHISYVYGGGCGFYRYGGTYDANTYFEHIAAGDDAATALAAAWNDNATKSTTINYGEYAFRGGVYNWDNPSLEVIAPGTFDYNPYTGEDFALAEDGDQGQVAGKLNGTIPYIKTSRVSIGVPEVEGHNDAYGNNAHKYNDHILIDSVFGGAENAFIGISTTTHDHATAIELAINGGTILSVFGGNNYGGAVAQTSMVDLHVHCTKLTDDESLVYNSLYHGMGRDFGIRTLFGGGNMVESSHAEVQFFGGMVDTAFIGGNHATVDNPIGIVDCRRDGTVYDINGIARGGTGFTRDYQNGHFIFTNPSMTDTTKNGAGFQTNYAPDQGLYNVHFLYGGNNIAPMENVSFIQLMSGGVGSVYGGGNMGDMTNDKTFAEAVADHFSYIDIRPLIGTMQTILTRSSLIPVPNKISSVIAAMENSQIIADYVYGGCRNANVKNNCGVYLAGGNYGDVFGGNDVSGDVGSETDGSTYVAITGEAVIQGSVYGGCDGYYHCEDKDNPGHYDDQKMVNTIFNIDVDYDPYNEFTGRLIPTQQHVNVFVNGGIIKGNLVAGGLMANVGFETGTTPRIWINDSEQALNVLHRKGTVRLVVGDTAEIWGNVFGGGANASIYGLSQLLVKDRAVILGSLFAGNDCVGSVQSFLPYQGNVDYTGCTNAADSLAAERANQAAQTASNGDPLNNAVGDGTYNPNYSTYLRIEGTPIINSVYGSGNGAWNYDGTRPNLPDVFICKGMEGDRPNEESTYIDINTNGGFIDTVFGGGAGSSVTDGVTVLLNNQGTTNTYDYASVLNSAHIRAVCNYLGRHIRGGKEENYVGTIFGGNNFDDMNCVPEIVLQQGNVKNVYGGGNLGNMIKLVDDFVDICDNTVKGVSTHILSNSDRVTVTDSVFGGCRMSDIEGMAYVEVRKTSTAGIKYLYGGNDIGGNVKGNTRVDMSGGTVHRMWGGSNGRYDFAPVGYREYNVYSFGGYDADHPNDNLIATHVGKPDIDSTNINLWGGNINSSVFTGSSMADCRTTCLVVNDEIGCPGAGPLTVQGSLFGGGEGRWDDLNARDLEGKRWGNVTEATHVHLHHATHVKTATAYGGGMGGDVENTYIKAYPTYDSAFLALYGGCWGSDVHNTTHLEFDGKNLVHNLYGGNDFTGNVYKTEITVNSGHFHNVFGGGNGDYPDSYYTSQHPKALLPQYSYLNPSPTAYADDDSSLVHPNTEYISITFNDGEVDSCLYGGGRMGTTMTYKRNADRTYYYETADTRQLHRVPDTTRTNETTVSSPEDFAHIVVNIHDGLFHRNIFTGGRGSKGNKKPIVYGLKVLNMDGGNIYESLYGGSEFVNDGYPAECLSSAVTTMRPSSIVNITGGTVGSNLYGAGYQGMVYGSVYVNIGQDAIDSCPVWRNSYGTDTEDSTYILFKPGTDLWREYPYTGGSMWVESYHTEPLQTNELMLNLSVYSGANWGVANGESVFNTPGFRGGESRLYIDGKGYNTSNNDVAVEPTMNIKRSILGSGTSVLGGDILSEVVVRNYGVMDACHPTRTIESIQRTDSLWLHNTAILLTGTTDASSADMSNRYSVYNVGVYSYRGYNVTEFAAALDEVGNLAFYEQSTQSDHYHDGTIFEAPYVEAAQTELDNLVDSECPAAACGDDKNICDKIYMVNPSVANKRHTLLILDNGIDFSIRKNGTFGTVKGFANVATPGGYSSQITARYKVPDDTNTNDGGFMAACEDVNKKASVSDGSITWEDDNPSEHPYTNHEGECFRVWRTGDEQGLREREATIIAHARPAKRAQDQSVTITAGAYVTGLAIAEAVLELPAAPNGNYYKLTDDGFLLRGSNGEIILTDSAFAPNITSNLATFAARYNANPRQTIDDCGTWRTATLGLEEDLYGVKAIHANPANTFGLAMVPGENFHINEGNYVMPSRESVNHSSTTHADLVISGNARVNTSYPYCSPEIHFTDGEQVKPTMRLYLAYDSTFTTAFTGEVVFKLMEYTQDSVEVGPIQVTIYIQSVIEELTDIKQNVLAMYNGGRTNTFTRKIELPPCGEVRNLYITGIKWLPTDENGNDIDDGHMGTFNTSADRFSLMGDSSLVWAESGDYPLVADANPSNHNSHNRFALTIIPSNNVSDDVAMANGWIRGTDKRTNIYKLAYPNQTSAVKTCVWDDENDEVDTVTTRSVENEQKGYFVGTLDGRGTAVIDVELTFDGRRVYDKISGNGYIGKAVLTLESISDVENVSRGTFHVTIYVKTRAHGDTIYLASADSVTRRVAPSKRVTVYPFSDVSNNGYNAADVGKYPHLYVQSFRKALEEGIYQEGDVIAIIDTVNIKSPVHITGANGPAIEVIRYDGHHHELPDEQSVYRGPMVVVSDGNSFTAENIAFHGGAGAHITHIKRTGGADDYDGSHEADLDGSGHLQYWTHTHSGTTVDYMADTNKAFAPVIQVTGDGSTLNLREGTSVKHNWNGSSTSARNMGAISLTDGGTMTLTGNVTMEYNFGQPLSGYDINLPTGNTVAVQQAPGNGAVYVDSGSINLVEANRNTAIDITRNYLMPSGSGSWWDTSYVGAVPERYVLKPTALESWTRANVLLTRTEPTTGDAHHVVTNDLQSDMIMVSGTVSSKSRIGVRKWFPGPNDRDTIAFATYTGGNPKLLAYAVEDSVFLSDDDFRVFYSQLVNNAKAYFFRCASFKHQWYVAGTHEYVDPVHDVNGLTLQASPVLYFGEKRSVCPEGGDSIIYHVQGGLMPYTFTWSDPDKGTTLSTRTTPYSNTLVQYELLGGENGTSITGANRYAKYAESTADTLLLPYEPMSANEDRKWNHLRVTATDATGECRLYKDIDIRIKMTKEAVEGKEVTYWPKASDENDTASHTDNASPWRTDTIGTGWTDTNRAVKAIVSRNYRGVSIIPYVWVERTGGITLAKTTNEDESLGEVYQWLGENDTARFTKLLFCPGEVIYLSTQPKTESVKFIMWDFDPYYSQLARYVIPTQTSSVTAYYGPKQYWKDVINTTAKGGATYNTTYYYNARPSVTPYTLEAGGSSTTEAGYVTTYEGDVHIYNENGLAWFISVVNGLNLTQARPFFFNSVYLHDKAGGYDMKKYLWSPVGTIQHRFRGYFIGVDENATSTMPKCHYENASNHAIIDESTAISLGEGNVDTVYDPITIKNIIVNEPNMDYTGFFGNLDSARIRNITLEGALVRGAQFVGALAAKAVGTLVDHCNVINYADNGYTGGKVTSVLTTHHTSGGLIGWAERDTITYSDTKVKYVGDAVYSGGLVGYGSASTIENSSARNDNRMEGVYVGGIGGYLNGSGNPLFSTKAANRSSVRNNYVYLTTNGKSQRVGGLVGYAENTDIENNYVYGDVDGSLTSGAISAMLASGASADNNYYEQGSSDKIVGSQRTGVHVATTTTFSGQGNRVHTAMPVYGVDNLTRVLNKWVRANGNKHWRTWRSDLLGHNNGYPVFGKPDMIPVEDSIVVEGCDTIEWRGVIYTENVTTSYTYTDSVEMVDSIVSMVVIVHHGSHTDFTDSVKIGEDYSGYGFSVSAAETQLLRNTVDSLGYATLVLSDTLSAADFGCDSVVTLTLTVTRDQSTIRVAPVKIHIYPNPTTSIVNVTADGMSRVEVYDNEGRKLAAYPTAEEKITIDLQRYSSGVYYFRVHTPSGVSIQKVIKK